LTQRIVKTLDMCSLSALFAARLMLLIGNNRLIGTPKITLTGSLTICLRKPFPQFAAAGFAAISDHERDNLAGLPAERKPNPALLSFLPHKRPDFIQFERDTTRIVRNGWNKCLCEGLQALGFFLASQSPYFAQHRTFVPNHVSCYALDRLGESLLADVPNRRL
jgi:hypothetical protein